MPKYFTTPIYYVNDVPHIGHAYCTLATDTLVRYWRQYQEKDSVWFLTGTDENSQKTVDAAVKAGEPIAHYLENMAGCWRDTWDQIGISYDDFIRTTEPRHVETVHQVFQTIFDKGDIYKGDYQGLYCTGCESFKTTSELDEIGNCPDHQRPPQSISEENYFFKLSAYQNKLLKFYEANPNWLQPESRKNEILSFIKSGLQDISISRETAEFGISLPVDDSHKVYVWFDALLNYLSAIKNTDQASLAADMHHIIGKDITRFHCVIWPAMLMSAGIDLPKSVFAHGFFTVDGTKMSKSLGNVVSPVAIIEHFGRDGLRAGLLSSFEFGNDGDFSMSQLEDFYNTKLAGGVGNLFNRVIVLLRKFTDGNMPVSQFRSEEISQFNKFMEQKRLKGAYDFFFRTVDEANQLLNETEVWKLAKTDPDAAQIIFTKLYGYLEFLTHMSAVLLPESTPKMQAMLGQDGKVGEAVILFERALN